MKKLIAVLMVITMLVCLMSVVAFADDVDSPEDVTPSPIVDPSAPQTGVSANIGLIIALAVVAMGTAFVFIRKATN